MEEQPAYALGVASTSLSKLVSAYSAFPNKGNYVKPYMVEQISTSKGEVIYTHQLSNPEDALPPEVAQIMSGLLETVVDSGTAIGLKRRGVKGVWAGKTGTAQNYSDAWFIGFNKSITIASWVGTAYPIVTMPPSIGTGSGGALPLVALTLKKAQLRSSIKDQLIQQNSFKEDTNLFNCPFTREENFFDKVLDVFDSKTPEEKKKGKKKRRSFLKRIFGKEKSN